MKKRNRLLLLLMALLCCTATWADGPFRNHRFDAFKATPPAEGSIIFIGNSITDMHCWVEAFETENGQSLPIVSRGVSGTYSTEQNDNLESYLIHKPKKVFMMIGTNDIATSGGLNFSPEQLLAQVKSIVNRVHKHSPQTRIYLFSILNNNTSNRVEATWLEANRQVKNYVEEAGNDWLKYVDLYDKLSGVASGGVWSYDKLHLTAASYRVWCDAITECLEEGENYKVRTLYPENTASKQNNGGLRNANGMRATCFSMLPVKASDILFFGDEEVQTGEWNELLGNASVKNRGTGWGYGGDIATVSGLVDATFANTGVTKACPKAILLYTGTGDLNGTTDMETVKTNYAALVNKIKTAAPEAKLYLLSSLPVNNATTNTRKATFNEYLKTLASADVKVIDCYTPFLSGNVADTKYIRNTNYLYGLGYVKMANLIKDALQSDFPAETFTVSTEAEAEKIISQATLRNTLGKAIAKGLTADVGDNMGQYSAEAMATFMQKVDEAYTMLENGNLTQEGVDGIAAEMNTLLLGALNLPKTSEGNNEYWYQITSVRAPQRYISATAKAAGVVGDLTKGEQKESMWKFVKRTDETYDIVNRAYSCYLNPVADFNKQITTVTTAPAKGWTISYGNTSGSYIISCGEVQLNQTGDAQSYQLYNWSGDNVRGQDRNDPGCQLFMFEAPEPAEVPTESVSYTVSKTTGKLVNKQSGTEDKWNYLWTSTATPQLTFGCEVNNMNWAGDNIQLMTGSSGSSIYTLTAPSGYVIDSYSYKLANNGHSVGIKVTEAGGDMFTTSTEAVTRSAKDYNKSAMSFTLTGENVKGVVISEFNVTVKPAGSVSYTRPVISTEGDEHWYYITNASTKDYCAGKVMYYDEGQDRMRFDNKAFLPDRVWSFWEKNGKLAIKNYNGKYMGTAGSGTGNSTQFGCVDDMNAIYNIVDAHGFFLIKDTGVELHAQNDNKVIVRWAAGNDSNSPSLWYFDKVDMSNAGAQIASTTVDQGKVTTGIGNKNQPILRSTLRVSGLEGTLKLQGVKGRLAADDLNDVKSVKAYIATNNLELFVDEDELMTWREQNGELFGTAANVAADGTFTIEGSADLHTGDNYLWIAFDIADNATEGHTVDAAISSYTIDGAEMAEKNGNPAHAMTIFLSEAAVLMPYDCGSHFYRIPAITTVKKQLADGTVVDRLVTLTDDRINHGADLPNHCYVVAQYSDDLGKSWTRPVRVAGEAKTGGDYGHGDASLVTDRTNGNIIGIMTSSGTYGHGFWASTSAQPQLWKTIMSEDGGETWSVPVDHTKSLYGAGSPNPHWTAGFSGSGAALQKRDGTLVSSFVNRENDNSQNFYFFMSKDHGQTWKVTGTSGTKGADEPKTLERNNGDLSIFVRASGYNYHNVTSDDGATWKYPSQTRFTTGISGNACDGEYMVWCSTLDGNPWNIAFETLPNSGSRQNVSICLSTDEGETFGSPKTICPIGSAYSTAVVLPDGTLAVYYEEDGINKSGYTLRYVRFSLDWASDGKYKFTDEKPFCPIPIDYNYVETGITAPTAPAIGDNATYDLQGRKVNKVVTPGIYIKNGQKVFVGK